MDVELLSAPKEDLIGSTVSQCSSLGAKSPLTLDDRPVATEPGSSFDRTLRLASGHLYRQALLSSAPILRAGESGEPDPEESEISVFGTNSMPAVAISSPVEEMR